MGAVQKPSNPAFVDVTELAAFTAALDYADLPHSTLHATRRALLDYLACAVAGAELDVTRLVRDWVLDEGGAPRATLLGDGRKVSATQAALVNGAAAHGLDFDDGQTRGSVHPGGVIFSAALAAAQEQNAAAGDVIAGVVAGYEVMLRIAGAMHPRSAKKGWHNTAVAGVFGAAATAARIRKLDAEATRNALGIAASFAGGLRQYLHDGAEVKRLHPGKAARDGLTCAALAARGMTGAIAALQGEHGLFSATLSHEVDQEVLAQGLGQGGYLVESAYFKPYPCCRHYHAAIDAALELRGEIGIPQDITAIRIGLYAVGAAGHDHITTRNLLEVQMSAPCAVVAALIHGRVGRAEVSPEGFVDPQARRLLQLCTTVVDAECEAAYPALRSGVVDITLTDGRLLTRRIGDPRGESGNPLTDADLTQKFQANAQGVLSDAAVAQALQAIWAFDATSDVAGLIALMNKDDVNAG